MYMLVLQTFLLMMAAFLVGATLACLLKRTVHRFAAADAPDEALHIDVPPAVARSEPVRPVKPAGPAVVVTAAEAQRFERALTGDVAAAATVSQTPTHAGPMIEVQPLPVPPPPPASVVVTEIPVPPPVAVVEAPAVEGETYNAIAVASHDGSMLPPSGVVEADLPPPTMPQPAPEPLPVPRVEIPAPPRPEDAPEPPHQSYIDEAIAAGAVFVPQPEPEPVDFEIPPVDLDQYEVPPEGETYASIAIGGEAPATTPTPAATDADAAVVDVIETTHISSALAAAAGIAAQRAADGVDDLTRIQGIDDVLASRLHYAGVSRFSEIANWTADDVRRMSQSLGFFGRIQDEYWMDQARELAGKSTLPPPARRATPAGAAGIATAAAAAAAAAMVSSVSSRTPRAEPAADAPLRPAKLADAIRENNPPDNAPEVTQVETTSRSASNLTGLRSVRAEALLGDDAEFVRGDLDDLKRIRGIGVLIEKKLNSLGVTSYEQVANWSASDIERISEILDFKGRIEREGWIEQARILASGGQTEFSRRVDRGEA